MNKKGMKNFPDKFAGYIGSFGLITIRKEENKFVAAQAGHRVLFTHITFEYAGNLFKQLISDTMT